MTTPSPTRGAIRHVELRPLGPVDSDRLLAWLGAGEAEAWLASLEGDASRQGWIVAESGSPVGLAGFLDIDRGHQRCGWTRYLAVSDAGLDAYVHYWSVEYVFEGLRFAKLWCETPATDAYSLEMLTSSGFVSEARLRGHAVVHGEERADVMRLGMLSNDWRARRSAMAARLKSHGFDAPEIG